MQRVQRKLEHIKYAVELADGPAGTRFEDLRFLSNCLPDVNLADIDLSVRIYGRNLRLPFFIDAVTGGDEKLTEINRNLAVVAAKLGIGIAVGSQYGVVKKGGAQECSSYAVIREVYPTGLVFANVSSLATPEEAGRAADMIAADALEVHLNPAQELVMPEGDRNFSGMLGNILKIKEHVSVPVIVKETGSGIAAEQLRLLKGYGFKDFNCAGAGGTNFAAIEAARAQKELSKDLLCWGQPTCWSLLDCSQNLTEEDLLLASGGIRSASDVVKAFALGADLVGITGIVLKLVLQHGVTAATEYFLQLAEDVKHYLVLTGCKHPYALRGVPLVITDSTYQYINCRGYNLEAVCRGRR